MATLQFRSQSLLIICLLFCSALGYGQDDTLIPFREGNLWGYSDAMGNLVVQPRYERTFFFSPDGLARVKERGLYGYIDRDGKLVIIPQYTYAGDFFMGVAEVEKQKRRFCINPEGAPEECNPPEEDEFYEDEEIQPFEVYQDSTGARHLVFTNSGDTLSQRFDSIRFVSRYFFPMVNYFALVSRGKLWGAYNENGLLIAPIEFDALDILDMKSFKARKNSKWGVLHFHGGVIIPFDYDSIAKVSDVQSDADDIVRREHYVVGKQNKYGILDAKGRTIVPLDYDGVSIPPPCNCPQEFILQKDGLSGMVDGEGKTILPMRFAFVSPFGGSKYTLVKDSRGREGYVSREGKEYFRD